MSSEGGRPEPHLGVKEVNLERPTLATRGIHLGFWLGLLLGVIALLFGVSEALVEERPVLLEVCLGLFMAFGLGLAGGGLLWALGTLLEIFLGAFREQPRDVDEILDEIEEREERKAEETASAALPPERAQPGNGEFKPGPAASSEAQDKLEAGDEQPA